MLFCIFVFQNLIFNSSNTGILEFYIFKYLHILYFENIGIPYLQKSIYLINAKVSTYSQPLDVSQYQYDRDIQNLHSGSPLLCRK